MPGPDAPQDVAATFCATLIDEWVSLGVQHAVVAPGSRSTPMAVALTARTDIHTHVFHDERSAAFAALGIGLHGMPAILLCTSGTAAAHFHAAVIEAHQSSVPMLVCTADRPPELRDVGAPQTIDQIKLYGSAVRWFHDPGVAEWTTSSSWRALAAHAFTKATTSWPGPVHINLPFREPLLGNAAELPLRSAAATDAPRSMAAIDDDGVEAVAGRLRGRCGVLVAGRGCGSPDAVRQLAQRLGWPVLADARSGVRHFTDVAVAAADRLLRSDTFAEAHRPVVVVRLGELPASKVINQWLSATGAEHIAVSAHPAWFDPDAVVSMHVLADPSRLCRRLSAAVDRPYDSRWLAGWIAAETAAQQRIDEILSGPELDEPLVARAIASLLPSPANLVVSSSMPIRDVEWFGIVPAGVTVQSNRGANGIDGVLATAIGIGLATGRTTGLLIGDVAFLHDSSSLTGLVRRDVDLRIVVVDNDGGGIFNFLPQAAALDDDRFERLFGTPHGADIVALAVAHGLPARSVKTLDDLREALSEPGPRVTRVETDRRRNVTVHQRLNHE